MHNLKAGTFDRIQKLQKNSLRFCLQRDNRTNVNLLHKYSNTNMLRDRRKTNLCNSIYKRKSNKALLQKDPDNCRDLKRTFLLNTIVTTRPFKIV